MKVRANEAIAARVARRLTAALSPLAERSRLLHPDLHPEMRVMMGLTRLTGNHSIAALPIPKARKAMALGIRLTAASKPTPVGSVRDLEVAGGAGPLPARHYVAVPLARRRPLLVFFHGGGFCLGDLDTHDEACRELCAEGGFDVLSVAYRLAPEQPFPAAIEDSLAAVRWAREHADDLGIDPARVGVGGDSAGGTLSAAACLIMRDQGETPPALQLLIYPACDRSKPYPSAAEFGDLGLVLTKTDVETFNRNYVRDPRELLDFRASPLLAESHANLPPAIVVTATCDVLRDESDAYAEKLKEAGNHVKHLRMQGMVHGFIHMNAVSPAAKRNLRTIARSTANIFAFLDRPQSQTNDGASA